MTTDLILYAARPGDPNYPDGVKEIRVTLGNKTVVVGKKKRVLSKRKFRFEGYERGE